MENGLEVAKIPNFPLELLIETLTWVIAITWSASDSDASFRVVVPPRPGSPYLALMQVCRRWRDAVISSPIFWTRYSLDLTDRLTSVHSLGKEPSFALMEKWLCYGGDCVKDLVIIDSHPETATEGNFTVSLRRIARRIRRLHFLCLDAWTLMAFLSMPPASLPLLEDLSIECSVWDYKLAQKITANPIFSVSPLSFIKLGARGYSLAFEFSDLGFTYTNIRTLKLISGDWGLSLSQLCEILRQCQAIQTLEVGVKITPSTSAHIPVVTLPHCQSFQLFPENFDHMYWCLGELIQLPALEVFIILCYTGIPQIPWQYNWYNRLLSLNIRHIKILHFPSFSVPPIMPELISILHGATKLESLHIGNCGSGVEDILRHILSGTLCPSLTKLLIADKKTHYETVALIHKLHLSAQRSHIPLQEVVFFDRTSRNGFVPLRRRVQSLINELQNAGLDLDICADTGYLDEVNWIE